MRPTRLVFCGLNSYETEQIIDFKKLTSAGLFGIFGPTGSGKSTIIDACTLALYSDMSRQSGRECVNTGCSEMYVQLEFEIHDEIYIVERAYVNDKKTLKQKRARLFKVSGGEKQILSDKPKEITAAVTALIGLNYNDFSRSVILPQGRFSEFLMLGERDRSDMLERIFGLEDYGDKFMKRLKAVKREQENELALADNSLLTYKDISQEALEQAEVALLQDREKIIGLKESFSETVKALDEKKKLLAYVNEYEGCEQRLRERLEISAEVNSKRGRLANAEKAALIKPFIDAAEKTEKQITELKKRLKKMEQELISYGERLLAAQALAERQLNLKDEHLPRLIELETKINQAITLEKELEPIKKERERLLGEYKACSNQKKSYEANFEKKSIQMEEIKTELAALSARKSIIMVQPERRQEIITAYGMVSELKKLNDRSEILKAKQIKLETEAQKSGKEIDLLIKELELLLIEKNGYTQKLEDLKRSKPETKEIYELKRSLRDNEPCPVCGATNHPHASNLIGGDIHEWDKEVKSNERKLLECTEEINKRNIKRAVISGKREGNEVQKNDLILERDGLKLEISGLDAELDAHRQKLKQTDIAALYAGMLETDKEAELINEREAQQRKQAEQLAAELEALRNGIAARQGELDKILAVGNEKGEQYQRMSLQIKALIGDRNAFEYLTQTKSEMAELKKKAADAKDALTEMAERHRKRNAELENEKAGLAMLEEIHAKESAGVSELLTAHQMGSSDEVAACWLSKAHMDSLASMIKEYDESVKSIRDNITRLDGLIIREPEENSVKITAGIKILDEQRNGLSEQIEQRTGAIAVGTKLLDTMREDLIKKAELLKRKKKYTKRLDLLNDLDGLFRGNEFIKYISKQHLRYITYEASRRMKGMTSGRYAIELDNTDFIIRDDFNGGSRRSPRTLSGGEVFMVSLCLALALSSKLQLKNRTPLEFFFLDEGFGTLDGKVLDTVMDCLERLRTEKMSVGIISHVEELKSRVPVRINVIYDADKLGSRIE